jgi:hypothetical protein
VVLNVDRLSFMMNRISSFAAVSIALASAALSVSCVSKPPLPKQASIERLPRPAADADYSGVVAGADIIYFPADRAVSGARSEPSAMVLEALRQSGTPFAIAWDLIDATQQPLLDELQTKTGAARDEVIARLDLAGTGRAREHCRAVLREARFSTVRHLALQAPEPLVAGIRAGTISPDEEKRISDGFQAPAGGLEAYMERLAGMRGASQTELPGAYRAQVATEQFAAEQIVQHFRAAGAGGKLLVFMRRDALGAGAGVPLFVAQKMELRQVILSSDASPAREKMLTQTKPEAPQ